MKNFLVTYHSTPEAMAGMKDITPEQMAEGMKPWMEWQAKIGEQLVEMGSPLCASNKITPAGEGKCTNNVSGFSIVKADTMEDAKKLFEGHPHLSWNDGAWVEVHESMAMG